MIQVQGSGLQEKRAKFGPLGLELAGTAAPLVLVIVICSSSKTASEIWRIFKDLSKGDIWSIKRSIKELYSYAYGVSLKRKAGNS
jgi:hypothetical protein